MRKLRRFEGIAQLLSKQFKAWGGKTESSHTILRSKGGFRHAQLLIETQDKSKYLIKIMPVNPESLEEM